MFTTKKLSNILFLDIETAGAWSDFESMPPPLQNLWTHKAQFIDENKSASELYTEKAGIYAEFGQVIVVSFGMLYWRENNVFLRVSSITGKDEKELLIKFKMLVESLQASKFPELQLCAHNGKEFDFPFLCRRYMVHQIALPKILQIHGKKPWEVEYIDTMELWKFGDRKSYTKLELLCEILGVENPKSDIDGSQVNEVYWKTKDVERIARYCEKDVIATAQVLLKLSILPLVTSENIQLVKP